MGEEALVVDANGLIYPCFHRRDIILGRLPAAGKEAAAIKDWPSSMPSTIRQARCFGEHFVSLFAR